MAQPSGPIDKILEGVVLYISKPLAYRQNEISSLAYSLGGEYTWVSRDFTFSFFLLLSRISIKRNLKIHFEENLFLIFLFSFFDVDY